MSTEAMKWAWEQTEVKGNEKLVLLYLADRAGDNGLSFHGRSKIARYCGLKAKKYVTPLMAKLESKGLIRRYKRFIDSGDQTSNYVVVLFPERDTDIDGLKESMAYHPDDPARPKSATPPTGKSATPPTGKSGTPLPKKQVPPLPKKQVPNKPKILNQRLREEDDDARARDFASEAKSEKRVTREESGKLTGEDLDMFLDGNLSSLGEEPVLPTAKTVSAPVADPENSFAGLMLPDEFTEVVMQEAQSRGEFDYLDYRQRERFTTKIDEYTLRYPHRCRLENVYNAIDYATKYLDSVV